jgi:hypothetical protein
VTTTQIDPVKVLADVLQAAEVHTQGVHDRAYREHVVSLVTAAIRAHTTQGAELRTALGLEVTETNRMGKHLRAAMDAFTTSERKPE